MSTTARTTIVDAAASAKRRVFGTTNSVVSQVMDSNDLRAERGITILAKNPPSATAIPRSILSTRPTRRFRQVKSNASSRWSKGSCWSLTPTTGRCPDALCPAQGAGDDHLKPIVVINKVDRPDPRPMEVWTWCWSCSSSWANRVAQLDFPVNLRGGRHRAGQRGSGTAPGRARFSRSAVGQHRL